MTQYVRINYSFLFLKSQPYGYDYDDVLTKTGPFYMLFIKNKVYRISAAIKEAACRLGGRVNGYASLKA